MSMNEPKTEWIRLVCTPTDKAMLEAISADNMDDGLSSTVRKLIRQEAKRRGITVTEPEPVLAGHVETEQ
jgi:hypothetical protein